VAGEKEILCLKVCLEIDGEAADGIIELGEKDFREKKSLKKKGDEDSVPADGSDSPFSDDEDSPALAEKSLSRLSPFKICEMRTEVQENGRIWKITGEKWGKLR
jgi:hypothetical protein